MEENRQLKSMIGAVGVIGLGLDLQETELKTPEQLAKVPGILETQRIHYEE